MSKYPVKENNFEGGVAGTSGVVNTQPGYGTFASPDASQNSAAFDSSNRNKTLGSNSNTALEAPKSGSQERDLSAIYAKKDTPSPDEVVTGIKYELGQQIKKDKRKAKDIVLANLRKDPHYYGDLKMLNIDDKSMVDNMSETKKHPNDKPLNEKVTITNTDETKKIFEDLTKIKDNTYVVNSGITDIMRDLWDKKRQRSAWKSGPTT